MAAGSRSVRGRRLELDFLEGMRAVAPETASSGFSVTRVSATEGFAVLRVDASSALGLGRVLGTDLSSAFDAARAFDASEWLAAPKTDAPAALGLGRVLRADLPPTFAAPAFGTARSLKASPQTPAPEKVTAPAAVAVESRPRGAARVFGDEVAQSFGGWLRQRPQGRLGLAARADEERLGAGRRRPLSRARGHGRHGSRRLGRPEGLCRRRPGTREGGGQGHGAPYPPRRARRGVRGACAALGRQGRRARRRCPTPPRSRKKRRGQKARALGPAPVGRRVHLAGEGADAARRERRRCRDVHAVSARGRTRPPRPPCARAPPGSHCPSCSSPPSCSAWPGRPSPGPSRSSRPQRPRTPSRPTSARSPAWRQRWRATSGARASPTCPSPRSWATSPRSPGSTRPATKAAAVRGADFSSGRWAAASSRFWPSPPPGEALGPTWACSSTSCGARPRACSTPTPTSSTSTEPGRWPASGSA